MSKPKAITTTNVLKLYQSIYKLPLVIFKDCIVTGDLSGLVISGIPTEIELLECFEKLHIEFVTAAGGKTLANKMYNSARVAELQFRTTMFRQLKTALELYPIEKNFDLLYTFPTYNPIKLEYSEENVPKVITSMIPMYKHEQILLANELGVIKEKENIGEQVAYSYEYFASLLAQIQISLKTPLVESNMSAGDLAAFINKYREHITAMEKEQENYKR
jgi:hypothetical protein